MKITNLTIKDLFTENAKLTFLVGAGCSVHAPSCLPPGRPMMESIIKYTCAESEFENILRIVELRFEVLTKLLLRKLKKKAYILLWEYIRIQDY